MLDVSVSGIWMSKDGFGHFQGNIPSCLWAYCLSADSSVGVHRVSPLTPSQSRQISPGCARA